MPRHDGWKRRLEAYERTYRELAAQLAALGFMHEGTVVRQRLTCGKASCICRTDPTRRHGPYFYWSTKIKGRTVSRLLSQEEAALYQEWIQNRRRFRQIQQKMLALAKKAAPTALKMRAAERGSGQQP